MIRKTEDNLKACAAGLMWFAAMLPPERERIAYREIADGLLALNPEQKRHEVLKQISAHARPLTEWKLLTVEYDTPPEPAPEPEPPPPPGSRIKRVPRISPLPEPFVTLTPKGRSVAGWPEWRRTAFLAPRVIWWTSAGVRHRLKAPLAIAGVAGTVLKLGLQWDTVSSVLVGVGAAVLAFLTASLLAN